jgi:hypothetical protein
VADVIIVRRTCSTCDATEDSTTNEFANIVGATITLGEESPVLLHVCKNCRASVFDGLLTLGAPIVVKAKRAGGKKETSGEHKCQYCERSFKTVQGRSKHTGAAHKDQVHLKVTPATRRRRVSA